MEEQINKLADFSLELINKDPNRLTEFYKLLSDYCCNNLYEDITYTFNETLKHKGSATLLFLNVSIKLTEIQLFKNPTNELEIHLEELTQEYHRLLEQHNSKMLTKKG